MLFLWPILILYAIGQAQGDWRTDYEIIIDDGVVTAGKKLRESVKFDLSCLWINEIEDLAFANIRVKKLDLHSNKISRIGSSAFYGLNRVLEELNLGSNRITNTDSVFVGMENLRVLNISDNPIECLNQGELFGVPKDAEIILKDNRLRTLNTAVFQEPRTVRQNLNDVDNDIVDDYDEDVRDLGVLKPSHDDDVITCIEDSTLKKVRVLQAGESLPPNCFNIFLHRGKRELNLQNTRIQSVAKGWYELIDIPVQYLGLSLNNLTEFSSEIFSELPKTVKLVDLSRNFIREIRKGQLKNVHIEVMNLEANLIENIEIGSFEFSGIVELNLAENRISDIAFVASLPKSLQSLNLRNNEVSEIGDAVFESLKNLVHLNLAENRVTFVRNDSFDGLSSLRTLNLELNEISELHPDAFQSFTNLERLFLAGNQISGILPGTTRHLNALITLDISRNPLSKLKNGALYGIPKNGCNTILIADNKLEIIESGVFENV